MKEREFYVLEGLDAVGKSTIKGRLEKKGFEVIGTPPESFPLSREEYDRLSVKLRFMFYLAGVIWAEREILEKDASVPLFCDRYLLTTMSAHEAMGLSCDFLDAGLEMFRKVTVPKMTFLLIADEAVRVGRLKERGASENDIANLKINSRLLDGYYDWSEKLNHPLIVVDTTKATPSEVVEEITDYI